MLTASAHSPVTAALSSPSRRKRGYSATRRPGIQRRSLHSLLTQQPVISVKCSSGHAGCCLKPLQDRSLPLGQPSPDCGLQSCMSGPRPAPSSTPTSLLSGRVPLLHALCPERCGWLCPVSQLLAPTSPPQQPQSLARHLRTAPVKLAHAPSDLRRPLCAGPLAHGASLSDDKNEHRAKGRAPQPGGRAGGTHLGTCRTRPSWP